MGELERSRFGIDIIARRVLKTQSSASYRELVTQEYPGAFPPVPI